MKPGDAGALFRPEVLESRRRSWLGEISLAQPLSMPLLTAFAVMAAAAIVLFLVFGEYTRRSRVVGQLIPDLGLATVVAPVAGVIRSPVPLEGARIENGAPLVAILTPRGTTASGDMTAGLLAGLDRRRIGLMQSLSSEQQRIELEAAGHATQLASLERELVEINSAIGIERQRVRIAAELLAHFQVLAEQHYVSQLQLTKQKQASLAQVAALKALQRQASGLQRQISKTGQALRQLSTQQSAHAATRIRELAKLDQERLRIQAGGEVLVSAPVDGLVASTLIEPGQTVGAGQPLLSLLPAGSVLQARLLVPSRAVGFIEPGDSVVLRYRAFPHQKFGHHRGTVLRVSRSALGPQALAALTGNSRAGEPVFRVVVELAAQSITAYGNTEPLRPGMMVEADILGERRKLYEWLLEPLYSLAGRLQG